MSIHLQELGEREWFAEHYEKVQSEKIDESQQMRIAKLMLRSQVKKRIGLLLYLPLSDNRQKVVCQ